MVQSDNATEPYWAALHSRRHPPAPGHSHALWSSRPEELCGRFTAGPRAGFENGKGTNAAQAAIINAEMPKQEL